MRSGFLVFVLTLSLLCGSFMINLNAGTPHTAYGKVYNSDSTVPANGDITFESYIIGREGEILTETSTGCSYSSGNWSVAVGNFPTAWTAGDVLRTDVTNTANGETGSVDVEMTNDGSDAADDLTLDPTVPVELSSFKASFTNGSVTLEWTTASESNNYGFEIQKKHGDGAFQAIGFVEGNGTTQLRQNYSYSDTDLKEGNYYYQLKQIDTDGSFSISGMQQVVVSSNVDFRLEQNYPNPFNPRTTLYYQIGNSARGTTQAKLVIFNSLGQAVRTLVDKQHAPGHYSVSWDGRNESGLMLGSGIYIGRLITGRQVSSLKMMFMK